jgi:hypothetical protein
MQWSQIICGQLASRLEGRQGKRMRKRSPLAIATVCEFHLLLVMATGLHIYTVPQQYEYQHALTEASRIEKNEVNPS